jgi:WD40 repeat protein
MLELTRIAVFTGHPSPIYALTILPNGGILSGGSEGWLVAWQPTTSSDGILRATVADTVLATLFLPALNVLVAGTMQGGLYFLDWAQQVQVIKSISHHTKGVFRLAWHENTLWTMGGDGKLTKWRVPQFLPQETLHLSAKSLRSYSVKAQTMAIAAADGTIFIIDTPTMTVLHTLLHAHIPSAFAVAFSPCGKYLVSGGRDALLKIWATDDYRLYHVIPAHLSTINDIAFAPSGKYFVTASRDKTIKLWDTQTFALLKVVDAKYNGHLRSVNQIRFADDETLFSVSDDSTMIAWKISLNN